MGLVQSRSKDAENAIDVEGFQFKIEQNLRNLAPHYGNLIVDFRQSFFGENFTVQFSRQTAC